MKKEEIEGEELGRGHYYQAIARHFFLRRGAPFLLSARDLEIIAKWETTGIPLPIVLEGIDRSFEQRKKSSPFKRTFSLLYCDLEVQKAFRQHQERMVGRQRGVSFQDKRQKVIQAIEIFQKRLPSSLSSLKPLLSEAIEILGQGEKKGQETRLEDLEGTIDDLLLVAATNEEKDAIKSWVEKEFSACPENQKDEILKTALLKFLREKYRVPHLLTCYY